MLSILSNTLRNSIIENSVQKRHNHSSSLPDDIMNIILNCGDLSELNAMMRVDKKLNTYINIETNEQINQIFWDKMLKKLHLSSLKEKQSTNLIQSYKHHIRTVFTKRFANTFPAAFNKESLINDLNERLKNIELENAYELEKIDRALDLITFWHEIEEIYSIYGHKCKKKVEIENFNSVQEILDIEKRFQEWCSKNESKISMIERLDLSYKIRSLPPQIGILKNLKTLKISHNKLSYLPSEIGQLKNLTTLELDYNLFSSWPIEIEQLTNLMMLNFRENQLISVPSTIERLTNLIRIVLDKNPISSLPAILKNVEVLLADDKKHLLNDSTFWVEKEDSSIFKSCMIQ